MSTIEILLCVGVSVVYPLLCGVGAFLISVKVQLATNSKDLENIRNNYKQGVDQLTEDVEKLQDEMSKLSKFIYSNLTRRKTDPEDPTMFR